MPKWGLAMKEGKVGEWLTEEGFEITTGEEVLEVETDKITSAVETPHNGILCRKVASSGEVLPVGVSTRSDCRKFSSSRNDRSFY